MAAKYDYVRLPTSDVVAEALFSGDRLALACTCPNGTVLMQVWETKGGDEWSLSNSWQVEDNVTLLSWADPENGRLLAASTSAGSISVWEAPSAMLLESAGDDSMQQEGTAELVRPYRLAGRVQCSSSSPIRTLGFAPTEHGLIIAAASQDSCVYVYEANRVLSPTQWVLLSKFQAAGERAAPCVCLVWRPFSLGVPPVLAFGAGGYTCIWQYSASTLKWQRIGTLRATTTQPVTALHWAPTLSRARELLAVANGSVIDIYMLSHGEGDGSPIHSELHSSLDHPGNVWKVEFDVLGSSLAVGTEDGRNVVVWRPDLIGQWQMTALLQGTDPSDSGDADAVME